MEDKQNKLVFQEYTDLFQTMAKERFEISLTESQVNEFFKYGNMLLEWNERINLTAITDPKEIVIKHFLDSLVFVKWINYYYKNIRGLKFADLGTGAGFPGIPIKIILPDINAVLIDSLAKRVNFLQEVIKELGFNDIETCHARAEEIGKEKNFREGFDIVVARAVAELPVLLEYTSPLTKVGGRVMAAKGLDPEKEIKAAERALEVLNCRAEKLDKYSLGEGIDYRSLIIIRKVALTPENYPRQPGKPKKSPL